MLLANRGGMIGNGKPYTKQVEWLRNTGLTQYINTGILGGPGLRVIAEVTPQQKINDRELYT